MFELPNDLYSRAQTRELDHIAISQYQLPAAELMRRAAAAALACLQSQWPNSYQLLIICGQGNNGGDGYELARQAQQHGYAITVVEIGATEKMSPETQQARQAMLRAGIQTQSFNGTLPTDSEVVIDALFGTGLARPVSGTYATVIQAINQLNKPVLALDIPSGIDADTGHRQGFAVNASVTISFIGLNIGLFSENAADYVGKVAYHSLAVPTAVFAAVTPTAQRIRLDQPSYLALLAPRQRHSHKGHFGHSVLIGGDLGMLGAIRLAAEAAARSGSGLVSVATHQQHAALITIARPEIMCHGVDNAATLSPLLDKASVLAIGPGLGQSSWSNALFHAVITSEKPLVVDADGLNLLAAHPHYCDHWILTPHPAEAARLLGCTTQVIQHDRLFAIRQLQQRYGGVIVLKGTATLIYDGQQTIKLSHYGNPGMSCGGMGDTLTGIITGLVAQGLALTDAAALGVMLHGRAADLAAEQGERGLLASDLLIPLRRLLNPRLQVLS